MEVTRRVLGAPRLTVGVRALGARRIAQ